MSRPYPLPALRPATAAVIVLAAGGLWAATAAQAAPYTLKLNATFSATSTSTPAQEAFAQMVWGSAGWTNGRQAAVSLELDYDDALTAVAFNSTQSFFAHETLTALRLTLGNVQFSTTGLTDLSKIDFGLRDNSDPPSMLDGDGFGPLLGQAWTRDGSGAYTLPGATTVASQNGSYYYAFSFLQQLGSTTSLEMRSYNSSNKRLAGGNPTGRLINSSWSAVPAGGGTGGALPEPSTLALVTLAALALARSRQRTR